MNLFLSILEVLLGIVLIICFFLNGKETAIGKFIGFDLNIVNSVIIIGAFYVLRTIINLVVEMAQPTSASFMKKFLMFFQIICGFVLIISGISDGRETVFEQYFQIELLANHGVVFLGVYYASKAVVQLFFEDDGKSIADV